MRDEWVERGRVRVGAGIPRRRIDVSDAGHRSREHFFDVAQGRVSFALPF
jgi:hypothetical protein